MRSQRERNRRSFRLESLEDRNAPSGGMSGGMVPLQDHRDMNRGPQQVAGDENHRGRDANQDRDRGRNDVVDNDPNDNDPNEEANEAVENHRGRGPGGPH